MMTEMKCRQITTFAAGGRAYPEVRELPATNEADEPRHLESGVLNLYPKICFQEIEGFGGAMTETSAYAFSRMDADTRKAALAELFGPEGNRLSLIRTHMDSCDFSLSGYTAVADPMQDPEFETFSLERDRKYILPVLKEAIAQAATPVSVLLSPWSPPACWKTPPEKPKNDPSIYGGLADSMGLQEPEIDYGKPSRNNGGRLKPEYYGAWAKYLTKYVGAYLAEGIPVTMMSIQNESIAATPWESCVWTAAEQKTFLRDFLYPEWKAAGLAGKVGIYIWDHNKERVLEYAADILDDVTDEMVEGIAFHWYSGDHFEALALAAAHFPDKVMMLSECCTGFPSEGGGLAALFGGGGKTIGTQEQENAAAYAHDIIGNLNAGMNRWIDWNLAVDSEGGPRQVPGGCAACMIVEEDGSYRTDLTFDYIGHFSRYIQPGAKRIGFSRCDDKVEMTAAVNPDGTVAVVLLNRRGEDASYAIRVSGKVIRLHVPAGTISTVVLECSEKER